MIPSVGDFGGILDLREDFLVMERRHSKALEAPAPVGKDEILRRALRGVLGELLPNSGSVCRHMDGIVDRLVAVIRAVEPSSER